MTKKAKRGKKGKQRKTHDSALIRVGNTNLQGRALGHVSHTRGPRSVVSHGASPTYIGDTQSVASAGLADLVEALRYSEAQRLEMSTVLLSVERRLDVATQKVELAEETIESEKSKVQISEARLRALSEEHDAVTQKLMQTQRALEDHQESLQQVYDSRRWRWFAWLDRLLGR